MSLPSSHQNFASADGNGAHTITEKGFRFLLLDTYNQLWTLLREYLVDAERRSSEWQSSSERVLLGRFNSRCPASSLSDVLICYAVHMRSCGVGRSFLNFCNQLYGGCQYHVQC